MKKAKRTVDYLTWARFELLVQKGKYGLNEETAMGEIKMGRVKSTRRLNLNAPAPGGPKKGSKATKGKGRLVVDADAGRLRREAKEAAKQAELLAQIVEDRKQKVKELNHEADATEAVHKEAIKQVEAARAVDDAAREAAQVTHSAAKQAHLRWGPSPKGFSPYQMPSTLPSTLSIHNVAYLRPPSLHISHSPYACLQQSPLGPPPCLVRTPLSPQCPPVPRRACHALCRASRARFVPPAAPPRWLAAKDATLDAVKLGGGEKEADLEARAEEDKAHTGPPASSPLPRGRAWCASLAGVHAG